MINRITSWTSTIFSHKSELTVLQNFQNHISKNLGAIICPNSFIGSIKAVDETLDLNPKAPLPSRMGAIAAGALAADGLGLLLTLQ
ncbi:hypothetical protein C0W35_21630 [Photobacterium kishitanii]|nr:hypothetical protein C0W35_21630 [Photobacterium kishitanii]